ncbi:hypothetical protein HRbin36_02646 [bacterium HR36]|nr:hypothetical protein HRbin36_02646 [bacterium HR36]
MHDRLSCVVGKCQIPRGGFTNVMSGNESVVRGIAPGVEPVVDVPGNPAPLTVFLDPYFDNQRRQRPLQIELEFLEYRRQAIDRVPQAYNPHAWAGAEQRAVKRIHIGGAEPPGIPRRRFARYYQPIALCLTAEPKSKIIASVAVAPVAEHTEILDLTCPENVTLSRPGLILAQRWDRLSIWQEYFIAVSG